MIPARFDYARAASVDEAMQLLGKHGDDAKLLAGGHSLLPMMKLRLAAPALLIDISGIPGLDKISASGNALTIGALTSHAAIASSADVKRLAPALAEAAAKIGDAQVRNRGTIGGSCAHAEPSADYPAVMLALDATFTVRTPSGSKTFSAGDFFRGMFETALEPNAVLTEIAIPAAPHSAYAKYPHPASHYAVVGVAAKIDLSGSTISNARIAITGVGDRAFRASGVEKRLAGVQAHNAEAIRTACLDAASGVEARSDLFASAQYRAAMAGVYAVRAISEAVNR